MSQFYSLFSSKAINESAPINPDEEEEEPMSALQVLMSIFKMPREIRWLCLTHLFSWSGVLTIFLFFTDYVGQVVYNGKCMHVCGHGCHMFVGWVSHGLALGCHMGITWVSTWLSHGWCKHITC